VVTGPRAVAPTRDAVLAVLDTVMDPEVPVLSVRELGIVRDIEVDPQGAVTVVVTPTYSGCPAIDVIERDILGLRRRWHSHHLLAPLDERLDPRAGASKAQGLRHRPTNGSHDVRRSGPAPARSTDPSVPLLRLTRDGNP
jgi:ring-1,2-phenylacetyl-CoA epoxidase subunit PaaD